MHHRLALLMFLVAAVAAALPVPSLAAGEPYWVYTCTAGRGTQQGTITSNLVQKEVPNCNQGSGTWIQVSPNEVAGMEHMFSFGVIALCFFAALKGYQIGGAR